MSPGRFTTTVSATVEEAGLQVFRCKTNGHQPRGRAGTPILELLWRDKLAPTALHITGACFKYRFCIRARLQSLQETSIFLSFRTTKWRNPYCAEILCSRSSSIFEQFHFWFPRFHHQGPG